MAFPSNQGKWSFKSLKMTPFDRSWTISYQLSIARIALSCTIFEIFDVEEYRDLEI